MATQSDLSGPDLTEGVPAASLPDGGMISGHVGEEPVLLVRLGGEILAIGSKCTHYGGPLGEVLCRAKPSDAPGITRASV
jgi:nitrite reductase/ring-hydroxylating ferredoxin subunit